jgi:putative ABC transport system ATP-binding protein
MKPVVEISHLTHAYGKGQLSKPVLLDINLTIGAGEIVILTGPSGSGKTTLLSLMGGLRSLQQGSLQILGQELLGATKSQMVELRSRIGYIFQAHNLLDCLTAQENVRMALRLQRQMAYRERTERAITMLDALGLGHRLNYLPNDLSGGQKQRVAIARALVAQPKLVLADEPTAALDSKSGREVVELMQRLAHEQGCTILLVTHDNRILDIAHRILHMEDGHLVKTEIPQPVVPCLKIVNADIGN